MSHVLGGMYIQLTLQLRRSHGVLLCTHKDEASVVHLTFHAASMIDPTHTFTSCLIPCNCTCVTGSCMHRQCF